MESYEEELERNRKEIDKEIEAFNKREEEFKKYYLDKYIIIQDGKLFGSYDNFSNAVAAKRRLIGKKVIKENQACLIKQVLDEKAPPFYPFVRILDSESEREYLKAILSFPSTLI